MIDEIQVTLKEERNNLLFDLIDELEEYYENLISKPIEWIEFLRGIEDREYGRDIIEDIKYHLIMENDIFETVDSIIEACEDEVDQIYNSKQIESIEDFKRNVEEIKETIESIGSDYLIKLTNSIAILKKEERGNIAEEEVYSLREYANQNREGNLENGNLRITLGENLKIEEGRIITSRRYKETWLEGKNEDGESMMINITDFCCDIGEVFSLPETKK
ncbi:hypothetical protein [Cetobacterium sp.]|uniref:hypothetical protein n=1 Tax=Cetobacterium sp. TaxID=2071632 RepID=UPI003F3C9959